MSSGRSRCTDVMVYGAEAEVLSPVKPGGRDKVGPWQAHWLGASNPAWARAEFPKGLSRKVSELWQGSCDSSQEAIITSPAPSRLFDLYHLPLTYANVLGQLIFKSHNWHHVKRAEPYKDLWHCTRNKRHLSSIKRTATGCQTLEGIAHKTQSTAEHKDIDFRRKWPHYVK